MCCGARVEFGSVDYGGKDVVKALNEKLVGYVDEGVDYPKVVEEGEPFLRWSLKYVLAKVQESCWRVEESFEWQEMPCVGELLN